MFIRSSRLVALMMLCLPSAGITQIVLQSWTLPNVYLPKVIGDVDGDGVSDVGASDGVDLHVFSGRTGALLRRLQAGPSYLQIYFHWQVGDVDGDGRADFFYARRTALTSDYFVTSSTTGLDLYVFPNRAAAGAADGLGDINHDGRADFLLGDPFASNGSIQNAGRVDVIDGATGTPLRSHFGVVSDGYLSLSRAMGDLDGDSITDYTTLDQWNAMQAFSGATGTPLFTHWGGDSLYGPVGLGDFNADGFGDYSVLDPGGFPYVVYRHTLVYGGPSSSLLWDHLWTFNNHTSPLAFAGPLGTVGDLDGDGHDDPFLTGGTLGNWNGSTPFSVVSGRDQTMLLEVTTYATGPVPDLGDVNADGVPDILTSTQFGPGGVLRILSGIAPGVTPIGTGCPDTTGQTPVIGIGVGARLGRTMTINLSKANPNLVAATLSLGFSNQQWNGVPLPIDLGQYGMPGCHWLIAAAITLWLPTAGLNGTRHHASYPLPIPPDIQLLGLDLYSQWLVIEPTTNGLSGSVTRAMRTTVVQ